MGLARRTLSAPRPESALFGAIAVDSEYCTPQQLEECLAVQRAMPRPVPLGRIMIDRGILTPQQVADILEFQADLLEERDPREVRARHDGLFGRLAVRAKLITLPQLAEALDEQHRLRREGVDKRLGEILVEKDYLHPEQIELVLAYQELRVLHCGLCGQCYEAPPGGAGRRFQCPDCRVELRRTRRPESGDGAPVRLDLVALPPPRPADDVGEEPSRRVARQVPALAGRTAALIAGICGLWTVLALLFAPAGPPAPEPVPAEARSIPAPVEDPPLDLMRSVASARLSRWCEVLDIHVTRITSVRTAYGIRFTACGRFRRNAVIEETPADRVVACEGQPVEVEGVVHLERRDSGWQVREVTFSWPEAARYPRVRDAASLRRWLARVRELVGEDRWFVTGLLFQDLKVITFGSPW